MNMDYKELIRQLRAEADAVVSCNLDAWADGYNKAADAIETLLEQSGIPSVAGGTWEIACDGDGIVCPLCKEDFCTMIYDEKRFNFCPTCGAKLEPPKRK